MKKLIMALCCFGYVFATTGYEAFLDNGVGAKSTALAQANFANASAESAFINPALISSLTSTQVSVALNKKWDSISEIYVATTYPIASGKFGLSYFSSYTSDSIYATYYSPAAGEGILTGKTYSYYASMLMLSCAQNINKDLSYGVNAKNFTKYLGTVQASAFAFDFGVNYIVNDKLNASFKISNLYATDYVWSTGTETPVLGYTGGLGVKILDNLYANVGLKDEGFGSYILTSLEGNINKIIFMRVGYNKDMLCAGVGVKFENIDVDYAFNSYLKGDELLDTVHRFGMSYSFDLGSTPEKKEEVVKPIVKEEVVTVDIAKAVNAVLTENEVSKKIENIATLSEQLNPSFAAEFIINKDKVVLQGSANDIVQIYLNDNLIDIRPDKKFFSKQEIQGNSTTAVFNAVVKEETVFVKIKTVGNRAFVSGISKLNKYNICVNNVPVEIKEDNSFQTALEFSKNEVMKFQLSLGK